MGAKQAEQLSRTPWAFSKRQHGWGMRHPSQNHTRALTGPSVCGSLDVVAIRRKLRSPPLQYLLQKGAAASAIEDIHRPDKVHCSGKAIGAGPGIGIADSAQL
eukprot:354617-Chlamydomonas_euryale.AAC.3